MAHNTTRTQATVECTRCSGSGEYLHFGKCFRCNGTGRMAPQAEVKLQAWWLKGCVCYDPAAQEVFCSQHGFAETFARRDSIGPELAADAAYQAYLRGAR